MKFILLLIIPFIGLALADERSVLSPCPDPPYNNALSEILVNEMEAFRPFITSGVPSLGIPPLDPFGPLPVLNFSIHNDYLNIEGTIVNTTLYNLAQFIVCEVTIDIGLRPDFFLDLRVNDFHVEGFYDMDGVYVSIFPIFGTGNYVLDVYNASTSGGARVSYNVITDHAQIHNLELDIQFDELELYMECILGCGQMSDTVNKFLSDFATAIFNSIWSYIDPLLTQYLEDAINSVLKDIKVTDIIKPKTDAPMIPGAEREEPVHKFMERKIRMKIPL